MAEAPVEKTPTPEPLGAFKPINVTLRKKIYDKDAAYVTAIEFREPSAGDIERCGQPVILDFSYDPPKITFDEKKMTAMISALSTVPIGFVRTMHPKDWNTCAWAIAGFFMPDLGTE
jgi:hypothetical protein